MRINTNRDRVRVEGTECFVDIDYAEGYEAHAFKIPIYSRRNGLWSLVHNGKNQFIMVFPDIEWLNEYLEENKNIKLVQILKDDIEEKKK